MTDQQQPDTGERISFRGSDLMAGEYEWLTTMPVATLATWIATVVDGSLTDDEADALLDSLISEAATPKPSQ